MEKRRILHATHKFAEIIFGYCETDEDIKQLKEQMTKKIGEQQLEIDQLKESMNRITEVFNTPTELARILGTSKRNAQKIVDTVHGKKPKT